ncbi:MULTISPECIES: ester cyclase [Actinomadura]|uniref:Ester cyclase n=1 Tax=Actinomadura yumaensis TaxID=111807 RepID=A0ABW2CSI3_9ACTN|nr:ester cyclase [Actinomadura sp. J1-007]MWK36700.1 ester cyclase [Actinomadura sp. J1-007]
MAEKSQQERNKEILVKSLDVLRGKADPEVANDIYTPDYDDHSGAPQRGPARVLAVREQARTAFPDLDYDIEEVIAEGDIVAFRMVMKGTHKGPLPGSGLPGTGKTVAVRQLHMVRFEGERIAEHWAVRDDLGMMQQLGVIPGPGGPGGPGGPPKPPNG